MDSKMPRGTAVPSAPLLRYALKTLRVPCSVRVATAIYRVSLDAGRLLDFADDEADGDEGDGVGDFDFRLDIQDVALDAELRVLETSRRVVRGREQLDPLEVRHDGREDAGRRGRADVRQALTHEGALHALC